MAETYIDKYKILKRISEGTSGIVFLAEADGKQFALKHLKASDSDTIKRFRKESSVLARLNHENLVRIFDVGEFNSAPYMVMEYLQGDTLAHTINSHSSGLDVESAVNAVIAVAKALAELHKSNLVHRDIKPANILVTSDSKTKLIDLGLVGDIDQVKNETALVGTPHYCSPEQSRVLKRPVDFRSDLYSLGVTFFETVSGKLPFYGNLSDILHKHAAEVAPDVRTIKSQIPQSVSLILKKMLAKDPDDRYQSVVGLIHDLNRLHEIDSIIDKGIVPELGTHDNRTLAVKGKFVQRVSEATQLQDCWTNVKAGVSGIVVVEGPSGSGKSRLCEEFLQSLNENDVLVIRGKCQFFDLDLPFAPIREAIDGLFDDISSFPETIRKDYLHKISESAKGSESVLLRLATSFRQLFSNIGNEAASDVSSVNDKQLFLIQAANFFSNLCNQWKAVIFLLDDLQWLDQSTLALLNKVFEIAQNRPLFLLGTARDDEASAKLMDSANTFIGDFVKQRIALTRFTHLQMTALVQNYLGSENIDPKIAEVLNVRSNGSPFIALEFLRSGIEQGFVFFKENSWGLNEENIEKIALTENVYQMILKRVETSSPEAQEILRYAALMGGVFRANDISKIKDVEIETLNVILRNFQELGLIERQSLDKWRFAHDKISESIRASINENDSKEMAFIMASYYHAKVGKSPDEVFSLARLCSLVDRADFFQTSILANLEAGKLSLANLAHKEGYKYLRLTFDLMKKHRIDEPQLLSQVASKLAICATMIADWEIATECSQLYCKLAETNAQRFDSEVLRAWVLKNQGDQSTAWDFFRTASATAGDPYPWYLQWKLLKIINLGLLVYLCELFSINWLPKRRRGGWSPTNAGLASLYYEGQTTVEWLQKIIDGVLIALKLVVMGKANRDPIALGYGYTGLCLFLKVFGPLSLIEVFGKKAEELCPLITDLPAVARIECNVFTSKVQAGLIQLADADLQIRLAKARNFLPTVEYGLFISICAFLHTASGHFDLVLNLVSKGLADHANFIRRLGEGNISSLLGHQWTALSHMGKTQKAQAVKKEFLRANNKVRFTPGAGLEVIRRETLWYRYLGSVDDRAFEMMEIGFRRTPLFMNFPTYKHIESCLSFICIEMLEKATHRDMIFSLSRKFKQAMMRLLLTTYNNEFKINYHYLLARYFRFRGENNRSKIYYGKVEQIAFEVQNDLTLFDIYRDKARSALQSSDLFRLKTHFGMAWQIATRNQWQPLIGRLKSEFDQYLETILPEMLGSTAGQSTTVTQMSSGQSSGLTHVSSSGNRTVQRGNRTIQSTYQAEANIEEIRFIDAILNVSKAFVGSIDLAEQSDAVLNEIVKLFAAERGFVFLKESEESELNILAGKSSDGTKLKEIKGFSSTVVKKVMSTGQPIIVTGTEEGEALGSESAILHNLRSIMATPLNLKGVVLGVVYIDSSLTKGLFTKDDIDLFSTLANHISVAFELSLMTKVELEKVNLRRELDMQTAVATESAKVKVLVDNVQQALFSVTEGGTIVEPISRFSEKIFHKNIAGENVMATLFKDFTKQGEQYTSLNSAITTVFGESELQWDLMVENIPKKIVQNGEQSHVLKVNATPLWDERMNLEKIIFVVEDITDLEILERQVQEQRTRAIMLEELFSSNLEESNKFLIEASNILEGLKESENMKKDEFFTHLLRELHTMKGNARLFNFLRFSEQVHKSESALTGLKGISELGIDEREQISSELNAISDIHGQYASLMSRVFASSGTRASHSNISNEMTHNLIKLVENFEENPTEIQSARLKQAIRRLGYKSIKETALRFEAMIKDISVQLGKNVQLNVVGDALLDADRINLLQESLLHLLRNSIDHGIEAQDDRAKKNKPSVGTITINCHDDLDSITLRISDDGSGMDPQRIVAKAIERGIVSQADAQKLSPQEKINLIFSNGFSTKDSVTEVSGRGIGMDVVKLNVEKMGGTISVDTHKGIGSTFIIVLSQLGSSTATEIAC